MILMTFYCQILLFDCAYHPFFYHVFVSFFLLYLYELLLAMYLDRILLCKDCKTKKVQIVYFPHTLIAQ